MDLGDAITLAGASLLVGILVEAIKRAAKWDSETTGRFAPILSILLGVIAVVLLTAATGQMVGDQILQVVAIAVITGIISGAAASGLYDTAKSTIASAT